MKSAKQTLVEEGTELKGTLRSNCQVVVNGSIDGQIEAPALTITETGTVLGTVKAEKLRSEGTLAGDIDAEDVYLSGTVRSNTMIRAKKLEVKLAPERGKLEVTFGECLLEVGEDPAHTADVDPRHRAESAASREAAAETPREEREQRDNDVSTGAKADGDGEAYAGEAKDGARRSKKNSDRRESQAPPAS